MSIESKVIKSMTNTTQLPSCLCNFPVKIMALKKCRGGM